MRVTFAPYIWIPVAAWLCYVTVKVAEHVGAWPF